MSNEAARKQEVTADEIPRQPMARADADVPRRRPDEGPVLLPARMLNEYAYCPRLFHLEWVQGDFQDNADTVDGRFQHRRVDAKETALPAPAGGADGDPPAPVLHARSVLLSDPALRLIARIDVVEAEGQIATPVDYKRGKAPDLPEGAWEPERVQVCAQALLLRAHGFTVPKAVLYFCESKTRVDIELSEALIERTLALRDAAIAAAEIERAPPPLVDSPKCVRCSLAPICLPDETNMAAGREPDDAEIRRLVPARDDAVPLFVQTQGATIGVSGDCLVVKKGGEKVEEVRLIDVSSVSCFGAVQVTTQAMRTMIERSIPLSFLSQGGWFYGGTHGMAHKNVLLRRAQYRVAFDEARSLAIARRIVATKVRNQRTLLRRNHRDAPDEVLRDMGEMARRAEGAADLGELLGLEGNAARLYFGEFAAMLKGPLSQIPDLFNGRNRRPPQDPVNAVLSFLYACLAKELTHVAQSVGFDPLQGFYHQPKYGKPALALDLMEEFRPLIADSVALSVLNTGAVDVGDFVRSAVGCAMNERARKAVLEGYARRMDELVTHPVFGYRISYRRVLEVQVRLLARHVTGEIDTFPEFRTR